MINENVCVTGKRLLLVPYLPQHVPRYHEWMCDRELLHYTASEQLTLEEEYDNQREWMRSKDKLTFIILAPLSALTTERLGDCTDVRPAYVMIGDCNLFLISDDAYSNEYDDGEETRKDEKRTFEVEVMIAERAVRNMGFGEEAVRLVISYALDRLDAWRFVAKILEENAPSIKLFVDKLDFSLLKDVRVFNEKHYVCRIEDHTEQIKWHRTSEYNVGVYDEAVEKQMIVFNSFPKTSSNISGEVASFPSVNGSL